MQLSPLDADINYLFVVVQDLREIRLCRIFNISIESKFRCQGTVARYRISDGITLMEFFMQLLGLIMSIRMAVFIL